jgi:hypothetical protein
MRGIYLVYMSEDEHPDNNNIDNETEISLHTLSNAGTIETMRLPKGPRR